MKAEEFKEARDELAGWPVKITSYKLGAKYFVTVDNVSPGAWIAKADGATLKEAQDKARAQASERLSKTRRVAS